jgi:hypothetical protein
LGLGVSIFLDPVRCDSKNDEQQIPKPGEGRGEGAYIIGAQSPRLQWNQSEPG